MLRGGAGKRNIAHFSTVSNVSTTSNTPRLSIAPMVDVSFGTFRLLNRLVSNEVITYTPMLVDRQMCNISNANRFRSSYKFDIEESNSIEHINNSKSFMNCSNMYDFYDKSPILKENVVPMGGLVAQISGCSDLTLIPTAYMLVSQGYWALNINMGCPSSAAQDGAHGALLMIDKGVWRAFERLRREMENIDIRSITPHERDLIHKFGNNVKEGTSDVDERHERHGELNRHLYQIPVSIKCRLGVNKPADYDWFKTWLCNMISFTGVSHYIVHGRIAKLNDNTRKNLSVPPLHPDYIFNLQPDIEDYLTAELAKYHAFREVHDWNDTLGCYECEVEDLEVSRTSRVSRANSSVGNVEGDSEQHNHSDNTNAYEVLVYEGEMTLDPVLTKSINDNHTNNINLSPTNTNSDQKADLYDIYKTQYPYHLPTSSSTSSTSLPYYLVGPAGNRRRKYVPQSVFLEYNGGVLNAKEAVNHLWGLNGVREGVTSGNANVGQTIGKKKHTEKKASETVDSFNKMEKCDKDCVETDNNTDSLSKNDSGKNGKKVQNFYPEFSSVPVSEELPPSFLKGVMIGRGAMQDILLPMTFDASIDGLYKTHAFQRHLQDNRDDRSSLSLGDGVGVATSLASMVNSVSSGNSPINISSQTSGSNSNSSHTQDISRYDVINSYLNHIDQSIFGTLTDQLTSSINNNSVKNSLIFNEEDLHNALHNEYLLTHYGFNFKDNLRLFITNVDKINIMSRCLLELDRLLESIDLDSANNLRGKKFGKNPDTAKADVNSHSFDFSNEPHPDTLQSPECQSLSDFHSDLTKLSFSSSKTNIQSNSGTPSQTNIKSNTNTKSKKNTSNSTNTKTTKNLSPQGEEILQLLKKHGYSNISDLRSRIDNYTSFISRIMNDTMLTFGSFGDLQINPHDIVNPLNTVIHNCSGVSNWKDILANAYLLKDGKGHTANRGVWRRYEENLQKITSTLKMRHGLQEKDLVSNVGYSEWMKYMASVENIGKNSMFPSLLYDHMVLDNSCGNLYNGTKKYFMNNRNHDQIFNKEQSESKVSRTIDGDYESSMRSRLNEFAKLSNEYVHDSFLTPLQRISESNNSETAPNVNLSFVNSTMLSHITTNLSLLSEDTLKQLCLQFDLNYDRLTNSEIQNIGKVTNATSTDSKVNTDKDVTSVHSQMKASLFNGFRTPLSIDLMVDYLGNNSLHNSQIPISSVHKNSCNDDTSPSSSSTSVLSSSPYVPWLTTALEWFSSVDINSTDSLSDSPSGRGTYEHVLNTITRDEQPLLLLSQFIDASRGTINNTSTSSVNSNGSVFSLRNQLGVSPTNTQLLAVFIAKLKQLLPQSKPTVHHMNNTNSTKYDVNTNYIDVSPTPNFQVASLLYDTSTANTSYLSYRNDLNPLHHLRDTMHCNHSIICYIRDQVRLSDSRGDGVIYWENPEEYLYQHSIFKDYYSKHGVDSESLSHLRIPQAIDKNLTSSHHNALSSHILRTPIISYQVKESIVNTSLKATNEIYLRNNTV